MKNQAGRHYRVDLFADGTLRVIETFNVNPKICVEKKEISVGCDEDGVVNEISDPSSIRSSLSRTKRNIYEVAHSMKTEWFGTFTFSPEYHINRYDIKECKDYVGRWFSNLRKIYPNVQYLCIPEFHTLKAGQKKKGVHFHWLAANYGMNDFIDSGRVQIGDKAYKRTEKNKNYRWIYNNSRWKAGFSNCTLADCSEKCANYMLKYVTKNLCSGEIGKGKQRYLVSENIPRPQKILDEFISGENSMFDDTFFNVDTGEYNPTIKEIVESIGNFELMCSKPCDIITNDFEYHSMKYFFKKIGE